MYWCVLVYRWLAQPVVDVSIVISGDSTLSLICIKCADLTVAGRCVGPVTRWTSPVDARMFVIWLTPGDSALLVD